VGAARPGVLEQGAEQGAAAAPRAEVAAHGHAERQHAGDRCLVQARGPHHPPVVLEQPHRAGAVVLDRRAHAPRALGDVDGRLGRDRALLGHLGQDEGHRLGVVAVRSSDAHRLPGSHLDCEAWRW
jgi:hypothetical protein